MASKLLDIVSHPYISVGGLTSVLYSSQTSKSHFANTSSGALVAFIVIIIILAIVLCILGAIATYRLTDSGTQVLLYLLFGNFYLVFAWIIYGMTSHKLVKMSRA